MDKIRIGIAGYGNLGKGVELAIRQNPDMELVAVITRRDPAGMKIATAGVPVIGAKDAESLVGKIDVLILCGGSATDLPEQGPAFAKLFNTIDSFDTHANIPDHFERVDAAAKQGGHTAIISVGWDPGLFSLNRIYAEAVLPVGETYTFWGRGVSQGHSDAIRRVKGVKNAIQYTVPVQTAVDEVRSGSNPSLSTGDKHTRECFVVLEKDADAVKVEREICEMPNYFADYHTTVHFISEEELQKNHGKMPHGGFVIRSGKTGDGSSNHVIEYGLKLESNPQFTSSVLMAYARAAFRMNQAGDCGAKTVFDVAPSLLSIKDAAALRHDIL